MSKYLNPELREIWEYNPKTGVFTSKIRTRGQSGVIQVGGVMGSLKDGYIQLAHHGITYRAHILAWVWQTGNLPPEGFEIDHKNTIRSDNRFTNLRLLTRGGNNLNPSGPRSDNSSGARGVHRSSKGDGWFARITVNKKIIHLGTYQTFEEAVAARKSAEDKYWNNSEISPIYMPREQYEEKRAASVRKAWSDPELRAEQSAALKDYLTNPEARQKRLEQLASVAQAGTEAAAKVIAGSIWITDGIVSRRVPSGTRLPEGFKLGKADKRRKSKE